MTNYTELPLYQLEPLALTDESARRELAYRQTERLVAGTSEAHQKRVRAAWEQGFTAGGPDLHNPYSSRNNFAAPQRRAWRWGHQKRLELETNRLTGATE